MGSIMASVDISLYSAGILVLLLCIPLFGVVSNQLQILLQGPANRRLTTKRITPPSSPIPGHPPTLEVLKEPRYGVDWWSDESVLALERRALFSTSWLYVTHRGRFSKPGDYLTLSVAGFSFFLILGKDDILRGFHNVCRHRAYEVTRKECGSSTVLGCRYHGWSYDTMGRLTKAPEFETVEGFDKSKNSLFEVHTHVDELGLVFVNLDSNEVDGLDGENLRKMEAWKLKDSVKVGDWKHEMTLNWKLAATGSLIAQEREESTASLQMSSFIPSWLKSKSAVDIEISTATRITWYGAKGLWVTTRVLPQSATKSIVSYEAYAITGRQSAKQAIFIEQLKKTSLAGLQQLEVTQSRLLSGDLSPDDDINNIQDAIKSILKPHLKLERLSGTEIHPAARQSTLSAGGREDDDLCRELDISAAKAVAADGGLFAGTTKGLNW